MFLKRLFRRTPFSKEEMARLHACEQAIGYRFNDLNLLKMALSHKSYINEMKLNGLDHNERMEFLGDAVLELGISDLLMHKFPEAREGEMSKLRASIVNEVALSVVAREIELGRHLFLGKGEEQCDGREKNSLLSDAFEAVLGAVYLDSHFDDVFVIIEKLFLPIIYRATKEDINRDYKTKLQEEVQNVYKVSPQYRLVREVGPDHDKTFEVHLYIADEKVGEGRGKSKKQAEQMAAQDSLENLEQRKVHDLTGS